MQVDNMEQIRVFNKVEDAQAFIAILYQDGFEAFTLPQGDAIAVHWSEYQ